MKWLLFVISFLVTVLLYRPVLNLSFTQDDFFLLRQAAFNTPQEQILASFPNPDSIYFRPLGMQGYFYLAYRFFGLHEWMYRLVTIVIHSLNVVLLFSLSSFLFSSAFSTLSISFLYLFSPLHFASLGWLANASFVTGTLITLLILKTEMAGRKNLAIVLFLVGLLVNEMVITAPLLLLLLKMMKERRFAIRVQSGMAWMIAIGVGYMIFRLFSSRAASGAYELTFDPRLVAQNIRWLFLWSLGWPETVRDHFVSLFSMRGDYIKTFAVETSISVITTICALVLMMKTAIEKPTVAILSFLWFLVAISPIVFFRSHVSPHYAMIGSIGLYVLIISGFRHLNPIFRSLFLVLWLIQSFLTFRVNLATHWWIQHAMLSESLIEQARGKDGKDPILPMGGIVVLQTSDPKQAEIVLAGDSAMQVLYNDPAVKTEFVTQ